MAVREQAAQLATAWSAPGTPAAWCLTGALLPRRCATTPTLWRSLRASIPIACPCSLRRRGGGAPGRGAVRSRSRASCRRGRRGRVPPDFAAQLRVFCPSAPTSCSRWPRRTGTRSASRPAAPTSCPPSRRRRRRRSAAGARRHRDRRRLRAAPRRVRLPLRPRGRRPGRGRRGERAGDAADHAPRQPDPALPAVPAAGGHPHRRRHRAARRRRSFGARVAARLHTPGHRGPGPVRPGGRPRGRPPGRDGARRCACARCPR